MQLLVMLAAAPDTPAQRAPSPPHSSNPPDRPAPGYIQQRQEAEAEGAGALGEAIPVNEEARQAILPLHNSSSHAAEAVQAAAEGARASKPLPVAPNPHSSPSMTAPGSGSPPPALGPSTSPPSLTMTRAPSLSGNALSEAGMPPAAAPAKAEGRSSVTGQDSRSSGSDATVMSPQNKVMAAAAGAAAAAAAAGEAANAALAGASGAAGDVAVTAVALTGSVSKQGPASSTASPGVAAAAEAILPKQRLVTVNNPVKLQAIRLLGILGEPLAC